MKKTAKNRFLALVLSIALLLPVLTGCSQKTGTDKDLAYPIDGEPVCLDPQIAADDTARLVTSNCFEGLVRLDEKGSIVPGAAPRPGCEAGHGHGGQRREAENTVRAMFFDGGNERGGDDLGRLIPRVLVSHSMEDIAKYANRVLVMSNKKIAMYDTVEKVFARAPELLELGLSVPQVTKIFLKLREMGVDVPADVYTIPYAVKMILEAKRRREAGESLVLPREAKKKGGAAGC